MPVESTHSIIYCTPSYKGFALQLAQTVGAATGRTERANFPDGERYLRLIDSPADRDAVLVGGTITDSDTLEIYDLACGIVSAGARRLTLVIPYFGYATMERAVKQGEIVTAKNRARLLSSIPFATMHNRALLLDLHSEGIPHYFEGSWVAVHVYGKPVVTPAIRRLGGSDFVLACTDAGRAKWVQSLANDLQVPASFVFKRRLSGSSTEVAAVSAQVQGKKVIIYDDMIRTGGSLMNAAKAYRDAGAASLAAVTTHGVFPGDSLQKIRDSGLFTAVFCTDSHPRARELQPHFEGYLQVEPAAGLFVPHLQPQ